MKIIVLGAGLVGGPMALDLAADENFEVTVADFNKSALNKLAAGHKIKTQVKDLSDPRSVTNLVKKFDLALNAMPGFMGYQTLKSVIEAGKNVVDIAFFPEDPFTLDAQARQNKVTAIVDCGVAPGMSNILTAFAASQLELTQKVRIYVGGLPEVRRKPFEYKAVFSPVDVLEEYTRPARLVRNGKIITLPALSEIETLDFPQVGTLEAFNSDGLRSLLTTVNAEDMAEKTLRYPGHAEMMKTFRTIGFFGTEPIEIGPNTRVRPIDLTAKLFFKDWKMDTGEADFTIMRIIVEGKRKNQHKRFVFDLLDRFDPKASVHSMARATGYTATTVLRLLAKGLYTKKGISPPEYLGRSKDHVNFILQRLKERGVVYKMSER